MRIDRFLTSAGFGSRKDVKKIIKDKRVTINDEVCLSEGYHVDNEHDEIKVDEAIVTFNEKVYLMLHKPAGYLSATEDKFEPTVLDLIDSFEGKNLVPVGRLDKDTEGLLIITNDGQLSHYLTSPKKKVEKEYYVELAHDFDLKYLDTIKCEIQINDNEKCLPAKVVYTDGSIIHLVIMEGKYHQVKRMMHACDNEVTYLKRTRIGKLKLDDELQKGEYRHLTEEEIDALVAKEGPN